MTSQLKSFVYLLLGAVLMISVSEALAQATWVNPPTGTPPNCPVGYPGCDAPINVGVTTQTKNGVIGAQGIVSQLLQITGGSLADGRILISNASGVASWASLSAILAFKRSPIFTGGNSDNGDRVVYCPATNPHLIHCSISDGITGDTPDTSPTIMPSACSSDGFCDTSNNNLNLGRNGGIVNGVIRRSGNLTGQVVYLEVVRNSSGLDGCLGYDDGHNHLAYRIDLICAK